MAYFADLSEAARAVSREWEGIACPAYSNASAHAGFEIELEFDAPAKDVRLWWRDGTGARRDLGPLEGDRRVEIP